MSTATADVLNNLDTQPPAAAAATTANNDNDFTESETDQALALSENPTDDTKNPYLYTPEESATIAKIRAEMEKHYPPGRTKTWPSSKALADDINKNVGDRFGFRVSCSSSSVGCTRRAASLGYENFQRKRGAELQEYQRRNRNSNRCGCLFLARTGDAFGRKSRKSQDKAIYITSASYMHTNGCRPCAQQLLNQNISGGKYTAADSMRDGLQTLMDMMKYKEYLESKTIRCVLKEKLPASVPTTAALIANVRVRLKKMLFSLEQEQDDKQRKRNNQLKLTTEESNKLIDAAQLDANNGVLCNDELDSPEYMQIATKQLKAMLRESLSQHGDELQQIVTLLQKAYAEDDGFDYRIGRDTLGNVTAIVWQDGIMRGHCTRLLDVVMLDMMKRQQNSIDWPYCGPVLITGENKIATACEAIIVTESIDAYAFVMNATYEMSGVDRSVTKCIFADGIMSISLLKKLGIEDSCSLILDKYHLIEVDWPKVFKWHYPNIKTLLKSMVESYTEDDFMERFEDGLEGEVNTVAVMPSVAPPLPSDVGQVDGIPSAASLPQPTKKKSYVDMMRYLESFAKLVANHPNQDACIGAVEGLKSIISGEAYADNLTLEQRFQNHLNQFNASRNKNLFGGSSSLVQSTDLFGDSFQSSSSLATSTSFSMVPKKSGSKIPHKAAKKRRKPALERRHDKLAGKSQALHLPGRTNTKKRCCHFCQDTEEHGSKSSCAKYNALRTHLVEKKGPLKSTLMQQLGDSSLHLLLPCPPTSAMAYRCCPHGFGICLL